jgi:hypothetical protein
MMALQHRLDAIRLHFQRASSIAHRVVAPVKE